MKRTLLLLSAFFSAVTALLSPEAKLIKKLFSEYDSNVRPVMNISDTVQVGVELYISNVLDLDMKDHLLVTNVWIAQQWTDQALVWEPLDYHGIKIIHVDHSRIWKPEVTLENSMQDKKDTTPKPQAMVRFDGRVFWDPPYQFRTQCFVQISLFPFDRQSCDITLGFWSTNDEKVNISRLQKDENIWPTYMTLPSAERSSTFEALSYKVTRNTDVSQKMGSYSFLTWKVKLRRKSLYFVYTLAAPCVLVSMVSLVVFWLPPDCGEKITLGITVLLMFNVILWTVTKMMPQSSDGIPLLAVYVGIVMTLACASIGISVVSMRIGGLKTIPVPKWICIWFPKAESEPFDNRVTTITRGTKIVCQLERMFERMSQLSKEENWKNGNLLDNIVKIASIISFYRNHLKMIESSFAREWQSLAKTIDKVLFWVFLIVTLLTSLIFLVIIPAH